MSLKKEKTGGLNLGGIGGNISKKEEYGMPDDSEALFKGLIAAWDIRKNNKNPDAENCASVAVAKKKLDDLSDSDTKKKLTDWLDFEKCGCTFE